jgi:hypothetical protein
LKWGFALTGSRLKSFVTIKLESLVGTTSLLDRNRLRDSLGTSVGLVDLGVLCEGSSLQIATVKDVISLLGNNGHRSSEVLLHVGDSLGLFRAVSCLASRLGNELGAVIFGAHNIDDLRVGNSRVLEHTDRFQVALLATERDSSRAYGTATLLVEEAVLLLDKLPRKLIRNCHHFELIRVFFKR